MRNRLLISTAALLAGVALASAQNMPGGGEQRGGAAQQSQSAPGSETQRGHDMQGQSQQHMQGQKQGQSQRDQKGETTGQAPQSQRQQDQQAQPGQAQQGQAASSATLTTEQRTKIRQTVLAGGNVPRATNVNFSINVGTVVPTSVRVVEVPSVIVDIHPECRRFWYFVVGDEIIIVDRGHKIVAILAV